MEIDIALFVLFVSQILFNKCIENRIGKLESRVNDNERRSS